MIDSMKKNGYLSEPILKTEPGVCYICGYQGACAVHEIYGGSNRKISKYSGFYVWLCPDCHARVHRDANLSEKLLKIPCQREYLKTHTRDEFKRLIGRFYE